MTLPFRILVLHLKARTSLHPLFRLNLPVPVQVGTQVAMSANAAAGIITQQREDKHMHRMNLPLGTGIGRATVAVESALIADAYRVSVVSFRMRTDLFDGTGSLYVPIFPDIEMIPHTVETTSPVAHIQSSSVKSLSALVAEQWITIRSIFLIDLSFHSFYPFSFCERRTGLPIQCLRFCQSFFLHFIV